MAEQALDKRAVISVLTKSHHGNLTAYVAEARPAAERDPDFFARLVAWNHVKGQVRDARVALPIIALAGTSEGDYLDNALAHLADLGPREFVRALKFARETQTHSNELRRLVTRYLRDLERGPRQAFEGIAIQHREPLRYLYTVYHVKPSGLANQAIVQGNGGFAKADVLKRLSGMTPLDAALTVVQHKIPFLVARGALGKAARDTDVLLALIERMSTTELVTNMKWLESAGVKTVPALRAALEAKLAAAAVKPAKSQALKANRAAEALAGDEKLSSKLHALQEKQIDKLGGIDGNWLVLGDKSGSMQTAIETARQVSAVLARMVKGRVHLVFFDTDPRYYDVTGKTLEEIQQVTKGIRAEGGTSIGCGVKQLQERGITVDGIAVVSDGGENESPSFVQAYAQYSHKMGVDPSVYFYCTERTRTMFDRSLAAAGLDHSRFDISGPVDYSSLPNIVKTMRVGKYGLLDEIMAMPLRRLDQVLDNTKGMEVRRGIARQVEAVGR